MTPHAVRRRFRLFMALFITGLIFSGATAFPLLVEMKLLARMLGAPDATSATGHSGLTFWILTVRFGLEDMYQHYPWIAYGTDWLAFGHIVISLFFVGAFIRPEESRTTIQVGIAACLLIVPLALVCGSIRGIPFYWQLIDCSFGLFGILPLLYCLRLQRLIRPSIP
ncbi:MAG: cytoplasmic rane protein [Verrucomicrobiaceae bacterium]|nr:cytoplasmic rane protein [Verrucomicrobiaceae bacterium]